jgi:hypothetical protein
MQVMMDKQHLKHGKTNLIVRVVSLNYLVNNNVAGIQKKIFGLHMLRFLFLLWTFFTFYFKSASALPTNTAYARLLNADSGYGLTIIYIALAAVLLIIGIIFCLFRLNTRKKVDFKGPVVEEPILKDVFPMTLSTVKPKKQVRIVTPVTPVSHEPTVPQTFQDIPYPPSIITNQRSTETDTSSKIIDSAYLNSSANSSNVYSWIERRRESIDYEPPKDCKPKLTIDTRMTENFFEYLERETGESIC